MIRRNIFTKLSIAITLVALFATATIWEVRRVRAFNPQADPPFGMVGITPGQTLRLNIVNLTLPTDPGGVPPGPCRVVLSFRDANGRPFSDSNGQVVRRVVELQGGQSDFLDLNADLFGGGGSTNGDTRLQLRPFVRVTQVPGDQIPPGPCRATMEVFDNPSGRTSIFAVAPTDPEAQ